MQLQNVNGTGLGIFCCCWLSRWCRYGNIMGHKIEKLVNLSRAEHKPLETARNNTYWTELYSCLFVCLLKAFRPINRTGSPQVFFTDSNLTHVTYKTHHLKLKKQYTTTNNFFLNLKIVLSVLPLCTKAITLGHAGIVNLSV